MNTSFPITRPNRRHASRTALALGLAILLGGAVLGGSTVALLGGSAAGAPTRPDGPPDAGRITAHLRSLLDLSDEQVGAVNSVMKFRLEALAEIRADVTRRVGEEHDALVAEMRHVLTAEQFDRWHRHFEELRRRKMPR